MKVFIVGVNHKIQYVFKNSTHSTEFKNYLVGKITKHSISLIAEELSNEAIKKNRANDSVARVTALSAGIKHRYVDPDSERRELLGIPSEKQLKEKLGLGRSLYADELTRLNEAQAKYHRIREEDWLSQIKDQNCSNVLFLCGYNHIESFASLLHNEGHQVQVLSTKKNK